MDNKQFLFNTDETGRFIVTSTKTNRTYYIEPIGGAKVSWGDVNPSTKKLEGNYGSKYTGSIKKEESLINDQSCDKVYELGIGESPLGYISMLEEKYIKEMEQ